MAKTFSLKFLPIPYIFYLYLSKRKRREGFLNHRLIIHKGFPALTRDISEEEKGFGIGVQFPQFMVSVRFPL